MVHASITAAVLMLVSHEVRADAGYCIDLTVDGVRSSGGLLVVAVFDTEAAYLENRDEVRLEKFPATEGTATRSLCGLSDGRYGLALFHDENEDGTLDTNLIGIPKEGYGFGGGDRLLPGKPSFHKIAFELSASSPRHPEIVRMTYLL